MKTDPVHIVAITGGIGSGKTRVAAFLAKLCRRPLIDLDELCRQLLEPGASGWKVLKKAVDPVFFSRSGRLDRTAFRKALFADDVLRSKVDELLHPLARKALLQQTACLQGIVLVEIPLLFEAGWEDIADTIIVVVADRKNRIERIVCRDNVSAEQALQSIATQFTQDEKASLGHHVVDNSGCWEETSLRLRRLAESLGCKE